MAEDAPYLLIDGEVLNKLPGAQTLRAQGDGTIFAAYGRTADLQAWLADTTYNEVSLSGSGKVVSEAVTPTVADESTTEGDATAAPEPDASATPDDERPRPAVRSARISGSTSSSRRIC